MCWYPSHERDSSEVSSEFVNEAKNLSTVFTYNVKNTIELKVFHKITEY